MLVQEFTTSYAYKLQVVQFWNRFSTSTVLFEAIIENVFCRKVGD